MEKRSVAWFWPTFFIVLVALFSYANQLLFRYQVPPGGDAINHNLIVQQILDGQWRSAVHYHLIWHLIVAGISVLTGVRSITVMAWLGPMLLLSGGVTLFFFNKKYFGLAAGLVALLLFGFFSRQPLQTLYDGGFPDVLAGATVLPLALMALERISSGSRKVWATLGFILMLVLLLFSHHLTTLFALPLIAIYGIVQLLLSLERQGKSWLKIIAWPVLLVAGLLVAASLFLRYGATSSSSLASMFVSINLHWPFLHFIGAVADPNQISDITAYPNAIGEALVYLGLAGIPVAIGYFIKDNNSQRGRVSLLLLIWLLLLAVGSRNPHLGFPSRLMRDLAIPLTLLGGVFLQAIVDFFRARTLPTFLLVIIIILSFGTGWPTFLSRVHDAFMPNPLIYHLPPDGQMADWINSNLSAGSKIAMFPGDIYLPLFTSGVTVFGPLSEEVKQKITDPSQVASVIPPAQYIYFQYRLDLPSSGENNQSNLNSYQDSPDMKLVAQFSSPQEQVCLFKVVKTAKKSLIAP